jgi:hypothetical protein
MIERLASHLLTLSLITYPLAIASHVVYLLPQALLLGLAAISIALQRESTKKDSVLFLLTVFAIFSLAPVLAIESLAQNSNYLMASKLAVNLLLLVVLYWSGIHLHPLSLKNIIPAFLVATSVSVCYLYYRNGLSVADVMSVINADSGLQSSSLYGLASPLEDVFLTKNISAMFYVSLFGFYLYAVRASGSKLSKPIAILFLFCISLFFSRQAIVAYFILIAAYAALAGGTARYVVITASIAALLYIFLKLFDLSSQQDGAGERLLLWSYFFQNWQNFILTGLGLNELNDLLMGVIGIDNFHMFFMNQIGAYGLLHFIAFTAFCCVIFRNVIKQPPIAFLLLAYYINVAFQTYGYEFGNVFLFIFALNSMQQSKAAPHEREDSFHGSVIASV